METRVLEQTPLQQRFSIIRNLVFGGGGASSFAVAGTIKYLEDIGFDFSQIENFAGTSAGVIPAFAGFTGMKPCDMFAKLAKLDFKKLLDFRSYPEAAWRFFWKGSVCAGTESENELELFFKERIQALQKKRIKRGLEPLVLPDNVREITFLQMQELCSEDKEHPKDIFIATAEYHQYDTESHGRTKIWSACSTPHAPLFEVMMASMAIPGVFPAKTFIHHADGRYELVPNDYIIPDDNPEDISVRVHRDGGSANNCLLDLFDHPDCLKDHFDDDNFIKFFENPAVVEGEYCFNPNTLAISIYPPFDETKRKFPGAGCLLSAIIGTINAMMISGRLEALIRHDKQSEHPRRAILVRSPIGPLDFDANKKLQDQAFFAGAMGAYELLKEFGAPKPEPENYLAPNAEEKPFSLSMAETFLLWGNTAGAEVEQRIRQEMQTSQTEEASLSKNSRCVVS